MPQKIKSVASESEYLPDELHQLVRSSTTFLGEVIRETEGDAFFSKVEKCRVSLKKMRGKLSTKDLKQRLKDVQTETPAIQYKLAHAFALYLELVNCCETAYRSWKIRNKKTTKPQTFLADICYVLTAHPTEARSMGAVNLVQRIIGVLIQSIDDGMPTREAELKSLLAMLWASPLAKSSQPTPLDEADYIYSLMFTPSILETLVATDKSYRLRIRTWVGGDKDGHPGINSVVMKKCMSRSRVRFLSLMGEKLALAIQDAKHLPLSNPKKLLDLAELKQSLGLLKTIEASDGMAVKKWSLQFKKCKHLLPAVIKNHHALIAIENLLRSFPALVVPIELREDSGKIREALKTEGAPIRLMLEELRKVATGGDITHYVKSLVISHCESVHDMMNAGQLVKLAAKSLSLKIVPLFESKEALANGPQILKGWLGTKANKERCIKFWGGYLEVMVGYSDTSKQVGVLASRCLIQEGLYNIESALKSKGVKARFFHGSGGSVARGGGNIREQVEWWPNSAIDHPKMTIQGEMIQRSFSSPEILNAQCQLFSQEMLRRRSSKVKNTQSATLDRFAKLTGEAYQTLVNDPARLDKLLLASPFRYLEFFKIGSRPSKRVQSQMSLDSLRAIPWVLCWTQTRSLFPTWWGLGSAWASLSITEKKDLKKDFETNLFFKSFIKSLGFTLAKVEMEIWKLYWEDIDGLDLFNSFTKELELTTKFFDELTKGKSFLWHRPWLEESICLRDPFVHILNVLQIVAMKRKDQKLLRETMVGVSSGMLTTG